MKPSTVASLSLGALALFAGAASAQPTWAPGGPWSPPPGTPGYARPGPATPPGLRARWTDYREQVVLLVAGEVADLSDPDTTRPERERLRDDAEALFAHYQDAYKRSPRHAWRALQARRTRKVIGLELSAPSDPVRGLSSVRDYRAAIEAEEKAALAELDEPWMRRRPPALRPWLQQHHADMRGIYRRAWFRDPLDAWTALDLERTVRALSTLRRKTDYERSLVPAQVRVKPSFTGMPERLLAQPDASAPAVGFAFPNQDLDVLAARDGFYQVRAGVFTGWVHQSRVDPVRPRPTPAIPPAPRPAPNPTPATPTPPPPSSGITIHLRF